MSMITGANRRADRAAGEQGQVLVIFALFLVVLLGATALAVDYGSWLKARRDYQNAADAAVLTGAAHLIRPLTATKHTEARQAAWQSLNTELGLGVDAATLAASATASTNNGNGVNAGNYRVWVASPASDAGSKYPAQGLYGSSGGTVFVWVEAANQSFFSGLSGIGPKTIPAWATANSFANRFAVITLRKQGQGPPSAPEDIKIDGGSTLTVTNGDVGGNWTLNMAGLPASTYIQFLSSTSDTYGAYLNQNVSGMSPGDTWLPYAVIDGSGNPAPVNYIQEVPDPAYPAPCLSYAVGGAACLEDRGSTPNASTNRVGDTCPVGATIDRLPGGRYNNIKIPNGTCVLLDPTVGGIAGKYNGIYYITGTLDINNSGLLIGNGVTLVFDHGATLNMNAGATISLNSSTSGCGGSNCKYGAWTTNGHYSWSAGVSPPTYSTPVDPSEKGIAVYVCRSAASCGTGGSPSTTTKIINMNSTNTGVDYQGVIYAPFDNVKVAGQPTHHDIGQLVAWTVDFTGSVPIDQVGDVADAAIPALVEPTTSQATYP